MSHVENMQDCAPHISHDPGMFLYSLAPQNPITELPQKHQDNFIFEIGLNKMFKQQMTIIPNVHRAPNIHVIRDKANRMAKAMKLGPTAISAVGLLQTAKARLA